MRRGESGRREGGTRGGDGPGALARWLVPEAEQGSRRVRPIPGEPGAALLSTRALGVHPGAPPNGCLSRRRVRFPGEGGKGMGEAVKQGHRQS